jgi:hypothetical protein
MSVASIRCVSSNRIIFFFTILQQNVDEMKVESSVGNLSEEDSIDMKSEEIYTPSAFSVNETKPEVSLGFRYFYGSGSCMCLCFFSVRVIFNVTYNSESAHSCLICMKRLLFL